MPGALQGTVALVTVQEQPDQIRQRFGEIERLKAQDIADAILYIVTRPRHVAINVLIRPTEQSA